MYIQKWGESLRNVTFSYPILRKLPDFGIKCVNNELIERSFSYLLLKQEETAIEKSAHSVLRITMAESLSDLAGLIRRRKRSLSILEWDYYMMVRTEAET